MEYVTVPSLPVALPPAGNVVCCALVLMVKIKNRHSNAVVNNKVFKAADFN
jgi:hypothetical protein